MGRLSHLAPGQFAADLADHLRALVEANGGDNSGRWLEASSNGVRKKDYWSKLIAGTQSMTANDIDVLAQVFDVSAYDFVRATREHARSGVLLLRESHALAASDDVAWQDRQESENE